MYVTMAFVVGLVASFLISFYMGKGDHSLDELRQNALMFVSAAEKVLPGETGQTKLDYVTTSLEQLGAFRCVDRKVIRAAVEWAVVEVKGLDAPQPQILPVYDPNLVKEQGGA